MKHLFGICFNISRPPIWILKKVTNMISNSENGIMQSKIEDVIVAMMEFV